MGTLRQVSFLGGELAPLIHGRTDLAFYAKGLRTMRNFFPSKYGAAVSRPGSLMLGNTKSIHDESARLIPFVFSDDVSFALEFGDSYIRFWSKDGQLAGSAQDPAYEVTTTYAAAHLRGIKYAQSGDELFLARSGYAASILRRLDNWTFPEITAIDAIADAAGLAAAAFFVAGGGGGQAAVDAYVAAYLAVYTAAFKGVPQAQAVAAANAAAAAAPFAAGPGDRPAAYAAYENEFLGVFGGSLVGRPRWDFSPVLFAKPAPYYDPASTAGSYPVLDVLSPSLVADAAHPAVEWITLATQMVQETSTGLTFETIARRITSTWDRVPANLPIAFGAGNDKRALYPDRHQTYVRGAHQQLPADAANTAPASSFRVIEDRYYRGRGDPTGKGVGLFGFVGSTSTGEFVDMGGEPDYAIQPPRGTNPFLTYDAGGGLANVESPRAIAFFQNRLALGGTALRPFTMFLSAVDAWENFDRHTIQVAGESLLFDLVARKFEEMVHLVDHQQLIIGTKSTVRSFGGQGGGEVDFDSVDSRVIDEVGMADVVPLLIDGTVVFVRTKGFGARALSFTANTYGAGHYSGVDITHQSDHLFLGKGQLFDVFGASRAIVDWTYAEDPWSIVWACREDGLLLSLTYKNGEAAWARHDGSTLDGSPARYQSVCAIPETDEDAVYVIVKRALGVGAFIAGTHSFGLGVAVPVSPGWSTCVERMASRVRREEAEDDCAVDCAVKYEGPIVSTIPGLAHLNGEKVYVVAVGNQPQGPLDVVAGAVQLPDALVANKGANVVAYVGLGFVADLEVLDIANTSERMKQKAVSAVGIETNESRGLWAGTTEANLVAVQKNDVVAGYVAPVPDTKLYRPNIKGTYSETGRFMVRQKLPLPATITALTREFNEGER